MSRGTDPPAGQEVFVDILYVQDGQFALPAEIGRQSLRVEYRLQQSAVTRIIATYCIRKSDWNHATNQPGK